MWRKDLDIEINLGTFQLFMISCGARILVQQRQNIKIELKKK